MIRRVVYKIIFLSVFPTYISIRLERLLHPQKESRHFCPQLKKEIKQFNGNTTSASGEAKCTSAVKVRNPNTLFPISYN